MEDFFRGYEASRLRDIRRRDLEIASRPSTRASRGPRMTILPFDTEVEFKSFPFGAWGYMRAMGDLSIRTHDSIGSRTRWKVVAMDAFPGGVGKVGLLSSRFADTYLIGDGDIAYVVEGAAVSNLNFFTIENFHNQGVSFIMDSGQYLTVGTDEEYGSRKSAVILRDVYTDRAKWKWRIAV